MTSDINGTVVAIQGVAVSSTTPTTNQVLEYNGTQYVPTSLPTALPPNGSAGGDLGGTYPNPSVIALQGNAINNETLGSTEDGYVLTWDNADGYLVARPTAATYTGLRQVYFTSGGTWTCPAGVTNVLVIGCGGGGGGAAGYGTGGGGLGCGGGGALQNSVCVSVTSGNNYTIVIGSGGTGGVWGSTNHGTNGGATSFGTLFYAKGAGGAGSSGTTDNVNGGSVAGPLGPSIFFTNVNSYLQTGPGSGGLSGNFTNSVVIGSNGTAGSNNPVSLGGSYSGGTGGTTNSNQPGGGGGGAGPQGNGGNGGNGNAGGNATNGTSASANTGAGGGGGGFAYSYNGGNGGNGGSGYLYIIY